MTTLETIQQIQTESAKDVSAAATPEALDAVRLKYLGRKEGALTNILHALPTLPPEERKDVGRLANLARQSLEDALAQKKADIDARAMDASLAAKKIDLTLPGESPYQGAKHPLTQVQEEIVSIFLRLGFDVAEGPEVETDFHNFTSLNHPPDHPARDSHDTFYVKDYKDPNGAPLLLRTHTSPVQIRTMLEKKPPLAIIAPGRVFRHEAVDATHSYVFHQVEGLAVDKGITLADLKGVLTLMAGHLFGAGAQVRFRPSYFPFVEPGLEVDVTCPFCETKGCRVCKHTGWIEMLGAGLVHPNVFRAVGYDPKIYSGYAFGLGVERVAMLKYGIEDIRHFYENDARFLRQF